MPYIFICKIKVVYLHRQKATNNKILTYVYN